MKGRVIVPVYLAATAFAMVAWVAGIAYSVWILLFG